MSKSHSFLGIVLCSSLIILCPVVALGQNIPPIEVRLSIMTDDDHKEFLSLAQSKCPYVTLVNDPSAHELVFVGSLEFIKANAPRVPMHRPTTKAQNYLLTLSAQNGGESGYSLGSISSLDAAASKFAEGVCRKNPEYSRIVSTSLPIAVRLDLAQYQTADPNDFRFIVPHRFLWSELDQWITGKSSGSDGAPHQMPYELSLKILELQAESLTVQLTLTRFLNGAIVGNQTKNLKLNYDPNNTFSLRAEILRYKPEIMSWLAELVETQEWNEEIVLEEAGANR